MWPLDLTLVGPVGFTSVVLDKASWSQKYKNIVNIVGYHYGFREIARREGEKSVLTTVILCKREERE
ncbi:hypothetical protein HanPSC8_Chr08g0338271 [Helianthus annuus]|nr:hypothetical protein HanPSC8_Chr08g0338271 [Helianthus annuus]